MDLYFNPTIFLAMHHELRNQSLMIESVQIATQYIKESNFCTELYSEVSDDNIASQRVLVTCGYRFCKEYAGKRIYKKHSVVKYSH